MIRNIIKCFLGRRSVHYYYHSLFLISFSCIHSPLPSTLFLDFVDYICGFSMLVHFLDMNTKLYVWLSIVNKAQRFALNPSLAEVKLSIRRFNGGSNRPLLFQTTYFIFIFCRFGVPCEHTNSAWCPALQYSTRNFPLTVMSCRMPLTARIRILSVINTV